MKKFFEHNVKVKMKVAEEGKGFIPMAGWHQNYNDFKYGKSKGTITFINGDLTVIIDGKYCYCFSTEPIIRNAIKEMKLIERKQKRKTK